MDDHRSLSKGQIRSNVKQQTEAHVRRQSDACMSKGSLTKIVCVCTKKLGSIVLDALPDGMKEELAKIGRRWMMCVFVRT